MKNFKKIVAATTLAAFVAVGAPMATTLVTAEQASAATHYSTKKVVKQKKIVKKHKKAHKKVSKNKSSNWHKKAHKKSKVAKKVIVNGKVSINKIKSLRVSYGKTGVIRQTLKRTGSTKIVSMKVTVKKGKKVVSRSYSSAKLKAGKYSVNTNVKYKVKAKKGKRNIWITKSSHRTQTVNVINKPAVKSKAKPSTTPKPKPSTTLKSKGMNSASGQAEFVTKMNSIRKGYGLKPVKLDSALSKIAAEALNNGSYQENMGGYKNIAINPVPASSLWYGNNYPDANDIIEYSKQMGFYKIADANVVGVNLRIIDGIYFVSIVTASK